ncbi:MAG: hypothetical protein WC821_04280 [archaeon]|jgi:hypothetical protein
MTSEIAVYNSQGIALAADSAVTSLSNGKIYNSATKIFSLTKPHSVGIMFYGNADYLGIPWETLIKIHCERLPKEKLNTIEDYAKNFIDFIKNFQGYDRDTFVIPIYNQFLGEIINEVNQKLAQNKHVSELKSDDVKKIINEVISLKLDGWKKVSDNFYDKKEIAINLSKYSEKVFSSIDDEFIKTHFDKDIKKNMNLLAAEIFSKNGSLYESYKSGVVIAGFGNNDYFPFIKAYDIFPTLGKNIKIVEKETIDGKFQKSGIVPFAQREAVDTFLTGIDPDFRKTIDSYLSDFFIKMPDLIVQLVEKKNTLDEDSKLELNKSLIDFSKQFQDSFNSNLNFLIRKNYLDKIMGVIGMLPKSELAEMAETLITITSFKRKMSSDRETVGGPVDVVVISKGDGFIWIKKKNYYKHELNYTC